MNLRRPVLASLFLGAALCRSLQAGEASRLEQVFTNPPPSARPYVWWHWMGSNFSKSGITKDLEAMAQAGIGGATIFNLTSAVQESQHPTRNNPWPDQTYRSPAYFEALRHATAEAKRLGLELGLHNTVGYSTTGGPWITEEAGMQVVVHRSVEAKPGERISLPKPELPTYKGWGASGAKSTFYRDIGVVALPTEPAEVAPGAVLDLTSRLRDDDSLDWQPSDGTWQVFRFGHAASGASPHPVPDELFGKSLEADKISLDTTNLHWNNVLRPLEKHLGKPLGDHLKHFLIDSYEAGHQSWSPGFREEFQKRFGYDPVPWLPTLGTPITGEKTPKQRRLIGGAELTERFEHDYRTLVADLFFENGWKPAADQINAIGATLQFEPYSGPFDTVSGAELADVPMGEFWTGGRGGLNPSIGGAARSAGRRVIGMEAFTGRPERSQWIETPAALRKSGDGSLSGGANRMILHHWVHQPFDDRYQPGMGMGWWGTHFGRHQTWFKDGSEFFRYLTRIQALLQEGEQPIEHVSVGGSHAGGDAISWRTFRTGITVSGGMIRTPGGRSYRLLHVPHNGALTPEDVRRIGELIAQGAHVVSPRPTRSPSLRGYPTCDAEVVSLAAKLWDSAVAGGAKLHQSGDLAQALKAEGISPFIEFTEKAPEHVRTHHRRVGDVDLAFVANLNDAAVSFSLRFRRTATTVELWDPETGQQHTASDWATKDGNTEVALHLAQDKSLFVVLHSEAPSDAAPKTKPSHDPSLQLEEMAFTSTVPWKVSFTSPVDEVDAIELPELTDLALHPDPKVRYLAGTATYTRDLVLATAPGPGVRTFIDLGTVDALARVRINGKDLGVSWSPPFRVETTGLLKPGPNRIEITVSTTWHNRLVGDEQEPADFEWGRDRGPTMGRALAAYPDWFINNTPRPSSGRKAFVNWYYHRKDTPLRPSGLIGPVRMLRERVP